LGEGLDWPGMLWSAVDCFGEEVADDAQTIMEL
jgi:hypothetical protein